ncbi:MAG: SDR family oxidoreductase [Anaerolineae bacterium]|nr:SDR family oxidoreductase [Anaerolineae bacterium]
MTILVSGATGQFGSLVVADLIKRGLGGQLAVSVRKPERAGALKDQGVDVRQGDFDDPASLARAFAGVERLLLVSTTDDNETRIRQHKTAIEAARAAGVKFIAYTSIVNAGQNPLVLAEVHRATEAAILASGIPYAFLRNNWYLENELGFVQAALAGAALRTSAGQGRVGWALRADYALAAAAVMATGGHENKTYELCGAPATYDELGAALGQALGRPVAVEHINDAAYAESLAGSGLPAFLVPVFADMATKIREGALDKTSSDFQKLIGRPAKPLTEAVAQLVNQVQKR